MLNLEEDHLIFDNLKAVLVIQNGTGRKQRIINALKRSVSARDADRSGGTYTQADVKFHLPAGELKAFVPVPGDFIRAEADKVLWTIGTVEDTTFEARNVAWCKRVALNNNTAQEIRIYKPTYGKDGTGAPTTTFKLWETCQAHINEVASVFEINDSRRRLKITHQIFITEALNIQAGYLVKDHTGVSWNVARVTGKGVIGEAMVLDVETTRSPATDK